MGFAELLHSMHCIHKVCCLDIDIAVADKTIRYFLDIGQSEDWLALQVALLPCLIGYGIIARRLYDDPKTVRQSKYWKWIETYVADDYLEAMKNGSGKMKCLVRLLRR
jgi:thiaminase